MADRVETVLVDVGVERADVNVVDLFPGRGLMVEGGGVCAATCIGGVKERWKRNKINVISKSYC